MKLVKLAVMLSVALFAALLVTDNGALASVSSRTISSTASAFSSGVTCTIQNNNTGEFSPLTSVVLDYKDGVGHAVMQDVRGAFRATFTVAEISCMTVAIDPTTLERIECFQVGFVNPIAGTYTDVSGVDYPAHAKMAIGDLSGSTINLGVYNYYDFTYVSGTTATAIEKQFTDEIRNTLVVDLDSGVSYNSATGVVTGRIWGANAVQSSNYNFYNESTNYARPQGLYAGVLDVRP